VKPFAEWSYGIAAWRVNADNAVKLQKLGFYSPKHLTEHLTKANLPFSEVEGVSFEGNTFGTKGIIRTLNRRQRISERDMVETEIQTKFGGKEQTKQGEGSE